MRRLMVIAAAGFLVAGAANAAVTTYTTQAAFTAATGSTTLVTFNDFASEASFQTSSVDAGPFSLLGFGDQLGRNYIDLPPVQFPSINVDGTTIVNAITGPSAGLTITFDTPILAFGATFRDLQTSSIRTVIEVAGTTVTPAVRPPGGFQFLGIVSDTPFTTLRFVNVDPLVVDGFSMDNVLFATTAPVPAPGGSALALGVAGLLAATRRRRPRQA
jgi:hypothetical protein